MTDKRVPEPLPTEGRDVLVSIYSREYGARPYDEEVTYDYEEFDESEPPFDFEEAALRSFDEAQRDKTRRRELAEGEYVGKCRGTFAEQDGRVTVTYEESSLTGMEGTITQITFTRDEPGLVTIVRTGGVRSMMVLERGVPHSTEYKVMGLIFPMTFYARRVDNRIGDAEGELVLDYALTIGNTDTKKTYMRIVING